MILKDYEKISYRFDASPFSGEVREVVVPDDEREILKIVKTAKKYRIDIVPRGGGTGLVGGCIPNNSLVIDLSKLKKIKIDKKRKIANVQAGVTISELNVEAKKYGLWLPVIPASHEVASIGGAIATNASGIKAMKYGRMKNWIKSLKVIDGRGRIINGNIEDFCGSEGIYGIILSAELKLAEIPKVSLSVYEFKNLDECINFSFVLMKRKDVSAMEFLGKKCGKMIFGDEIYYLIVEYESPEGKIKDEEEIRRIWEKREGLFSLLCNKGYVYIEDPMIKEREKIIEFINWCEREGFPIFGHLGSFVFHVHFSEERKNRRHEMWRYIKELGGGIGEHGIGVDKKGLLSEEEKEKIKKLKEKYDPFWIFNNGKVIDRVGFYE